MKRKGNGSILSTLNIDTPSPVADPDLQIMGGGGVIQTLR